MAQAVASGVKEVRGANVSLYMIPDIGELDPVSESTGAAAPPSRTASEFSHVPILTLNKLHILEQADAIIFGFSPSFGSMSAEMKCFMEWWGQLWLKGALVGKIGSVFTAASTQQVGQELAIISTIAALLHHGMMVVGLPSVTGGMPYGTTTSYSHDPEKREPSPQELECARAQGKHVAEMAAKMVR